VLVLGLDPSLTNYGWALHETTAQGRARCVDRGRHKTSAKMLEVLRHMEHREHVRQLVRELEPDKVAIEYPVFGELYSSGMYGLFLFTFEALYHAKVDVVFLSNSSTKAVVRRYLARPKGWGEITKQDMIEAAKKHTGPGRWSSDEADAYWIAVLGGRFWEHLDGSLDVESLTDYERRLFTDIRRPMRGRFAGKTLKKGLVYRQDDRFFLLSQL
jgi:Holliday junction resolvasome RuvABC endonuclease subunit